MPLRAVILVVVSVPAGTGCRGGGAAPDVPARAGTSREARAGTAPVLPASSTGSEPRRLPGLAEAVALHLRGVAGDDEAAAEALERLAELHRRYPEDPQVISYLGSARVLAARRVLTPWSKGRTCRRGLALLDDAVSRAGHRPEIRFLRAVSTYPLPWFFERREQCARDLRWLAQRWEAAVREGSLTPAMAALALLYHGEICASRDEPERAREAWETASRLCPDRGPGRRAEQHLRRLSE